MEAHPATARNGPLAGEARLTVPQRVSQDLWPTPVVWSADGGKRHVYGLEALAVDVHLAKVPVYEFRRTLGLAESEPEASWLRPPRYLL